MTNLRDLCKTVRDVPTTRSVRPITKAFSVFGRAGLAPQMIGALNSLELEAKRQVGASFRLNVVSGFRDPELQDELLERWKRGEREGLAARPASPSGSRHTKGTAVDLGHPLEVLKMLGEIWTSMGFRWGGMWLKPDPVHFDLG